MDKIISVLLYFNSFNKDSDFESCDRMLLNWFALSFRLYCVCFIENWEFTFKLNSFWIDNLKCDPPQS